VLILVSIEAASARPMRLLAPTPAAEGSMLGADSQYTARFDGPIDHAQSHPEIRCDGQVVERLHPLPESAIDMLVCLGVPTLPPGHYVLH